MRRETTERRFSWTQKWPRLSLPPSIPQALAIFTKMTSSTRQPRILDLELPPRTSLPSPNTTFTRMTDLLTILLKLTMQGKGSDWLPKLELSPGSLWPVFRRLLDLIMRLARSPTLLTPKSILLGTEDRREPRIVWSIRLLRLKLWDQEDMYRKLVLIQAVKRTTQSGLCQKPVEVEE